ncbi:hypothetical protein Scep_001766 [Stephania cephalantha]|uniref:DUF4057 domain-containing protein n=1 Tax=Stephania cephalantha TaxID=152367 RepID=A0AAP0LBF2_9MAGN
MERSTPVRKSHTSTADLLTWPEKPISDSTPSDSAASGASPAARSHQPSDEISKVLFGGQVTDEEVESLTKRLNAFKCWKTGNSCNQEKILLANWWFVPLFITGSSDLISGIRATMRPKVDARMEGFEAGLSRGKSWKEPSKGCMQSSRHSSMKPCSDYKLKEITGSRIFGVDDENGEVESGKSNHAPNKTTVRVYQQALSGISQISFGDEESVSPKKPTSLPEVAKQRELSGTLESESDMLLKKQLSDAKCKELSGHDIFGPPPEIKPRPLAARALELKGSINLGEPALRSIHTSVKVSNPAGGRTNITLGGDEAAIKTAKKIHNQKFQELTGNDIFKEDAPPSSADKVLSMAKLREMSGSDIFADGKAASRDYLGGLRKPPGGESSIALV